MADIEGSALRAETDEGTADRMLSEMEQLRKEIEFLRFHDALTGLFNRTHYERQLPMFRLPSRMPVAVVIGDMNGLRIANDVFGRDFGDRLVRRAADVMRESVEPEDLLVRFGGDEFLVLRSGCDAREADEFCEKVRTACTDLNVGPLPVSLSLGAAVWEDPSLSLEDAVRDAESCMYRNKLNETKAFRSVLLDSVKNLLFDRCLETDHHTQRMAACCRRIADEMGLSDKEKTDLDLLAMVHDIGKIAVRDSIVFKPTALDDAELVEMRRHTEVGYRIAQATSELFHIAEPILAHHEWWNGSGYPQGASGTDIPLFSRILSVADSFDAMTNYRPFRDTLSLEEAAEEIRKGAGIQYDPEIAGLFLSKILSPLSEPAQ